MSAEWSPEEMTLGELCALEEFLSRLTLTTMVGLRMHHLAAILRVRPAPYPQPEEKPTR